MLPQPPPNAPAPPPSEAALISQRKWKWLWIIGLGSVAALGLSVLLAPLLLRSRKKSDQTEAVSNARQVGLSLLEFQQTFGTFPDTDTAAVGREKFPTDLKLGTKFSNDFFRQMIASEIAQSEQMFYAKREGARKPDNVFTGTKALEKGECGFTYLLGATTMDNPRRPLVVTPMIPGTDRFDPVPLEGKAVVLRLDNSVMSYIIEKDGHILVDGRNLMDPHHPIWDGHAPVIAWPE